MSISIVNHAAPLPKQEKNSVMNILYCGDRNIADGVMLSVLSLLECIDIPFNIYILTMQLETEAKTFYSLPQVFADHLDKLVKKYNPNSSVTLIDATDLFAEQPPTANLETRFTPCCMLRLFADKIEQLPDRLLYLDNDVICRSDCSDFYFQDIEQYELVGVLDYYGRWFFRNNILRADYLNSGVLLLNMANIRQTGLFQKCRDRCRDKKMFMPDQSAINKLAVAKKIDKRKYNDQRKLHDDTVFQHFTTSFRFFPYIHTVSVKPWQIDKVHSILKLHEYDQLFDKYITVKSDMENFILEESKA